MKWRNEFLLALFLYLGVIGKSAVHNYELLQNKVSKNDLVLNTNPITLLIEDSLQNFENALDFLQSSICKKRDFWLITFNSSGVSFVWTKSLNNIGNFYKTLELMASETKPESDIKLNESLPLVALLNTAKIMPNNGSIVVFANSSIHIDSYFKNIAFNIILNKNLTVYTISRNNVYKENDFLQTIREYSGDKITINEITKHENYKQSLYADLCKVNIIFSRKELVGLNELPLPIDYDVKEIHILIKPSTATTGFVTSPSKYRFSFSEKNESIPISYSQGSTFENKNGLFELHFNFSSSSRHITGTWLLKLENLKHLYSITVFAFTNINFPTREANKNITSKDVMKMGVTSNVSRITDITVLDSDGETLLVNSNNLSKYVIENINNILNNDNKEVHAEINKIQNTQQFYKVIKGKDIKGSNFQRLSYIYGKSDIYLQQTIRIEVGLGSELIITSGRRAEVYFEVTNQASSAQLLFFTCSDSKYILKDLSIFKKYLEPQESTLITLYLNLKFGSYQDEITFSVTSGFQLIQKRVLVNVGQELLDPNQPEVYHKYTSDCTGILSWALCSKGTWSIEITAKDSESGLLQLNTIPKGIIFPNAYTSGTIDSVTGYYSASCCNPDLQISAVDRMNNRRSYSVNAYYAMWSAGAIAALVLGILLFIILVGVILFFVVRKIKSKESYDLPTYRGDGI